MEKRASMNLVNNLSSLDVLLSDKHGARAGHSRGRLRLNGDVERLGREVVEVP